MFNNKHSSRRKTMVDRNNKKVEEKQNPTKNNSFFFRNFKRIYPLGIHRGDSLLSVSSLASSLTTSQNSTTDSCNSFTDFTCPLDQKILASIESLRRVITAAPGDHELQQGRRREDYDEDARRGDDDYNKHGVSQDIMMSINPRCNNDGGLDGIVKRCHWITKSSDDLYVSFHDEQWGVPVYEDNQLFELLALSAMLMDYSWTEILKRKDELREAFGGFDPNLVANMGDEKMTDIASNKELGLAECRARCFVENAKSILKIVRECGSFSGYLWAYFDYKPTINKYKYPRNVPLRSPKAEAISKDLIKRGFRLVGPVIIHSFMQAAGMSIDHLVDCFRYKECVALAENPWRHV